MQKATFAAGCFWEVEAVFRRVEGVTSVQVGYIGGELEKPTYHDVCRGTTGHAMAVEIEFDPEVVSYEQLLEVFWNAHDPSTPNRQGEFVGPQYRSMIFTHGPAQAQGARASLERRQRLRRTRKIVTGIQDATRFWRAEEYHQRYLEKRGFRSLRPGR